MKIEIKTDLTINDINTFEDLLQFFQDALAECKSYHFFDIQDGSFCIGRCFEYRNNKGEIFSIFKDKKIYLYFDESVFCGCHNTRETFEFEMPLWKIADNFKKIGLPYLETLFTLID